MSSCLHDACLFACFGWDWASTGCLFRACGRPLFSLEEPWRFFRVNSRSLSVSQASRRSPYSWFLIMRWRLRLSFSFARKPGWRMECCSADCWWRVWRCGVWHWRRAERAESFARVNLCFSRLECSVSLRLSTLCGSQGYSRRQFFANPADCHCEPAIKAGCYMLLASCRFAWRVRAIYLQVLLVHIGHDFGKSYLTHYQGFLVMVVQKLWFGPWIEASQT